MISQSFVIFKLHIWGSGARMLLCANLHFCWITFMHFPEMILDQMSDGFYANSFINEAPKCGKHKPPNTHANIARHRGFISLSCQAGKSQHICSSVAGAVAKVLTGIMWLIEGNGGGHSWPALPWGQQSPIVPAAGGVSWCEQGVGPKAREGRDTLTLTGHQSRHEVPV